MTNIYWNSSRLDGDGDSPKRMLVLSIPDTSTVDIAGYSMPIDSFASTNY